MIEKNKKKPDYYSLKTIPDGTRGPVNYYDLSIPTAMQYE